MPWLRPRTKREITTTAMKMPIIGKAILRAPRKLKWELLNMLREIAVVKVSFWKGLVFTQAMKTIRVR